MEQLQELIESISEKVDLIIDHYDENPDIDVEDHQIEALEEAEHALSKAVASL